MHSAQFSPLPKPLMLSLQVKVYCGEWGTSLPTLPTNLPPSPPQSFSPRTELKTMGRSPLMQNLPQPPVLTSFFKSAEPAKPPSEQVNFGLLKRILKNFLFGGGADALCPASLNLTEVELGFLKFFLKKKIIRSQRRSYLRLIDSMTAANFEDRLRVVVPKRRKSVVKGVLFRLFWKFASREGDVIQLFFGGNSECDYQLNKVNNNLQDEYYKKCFQNERFRSYFFKVIKSAEFFDFCLEKSRAKFDKRFDSWVLSNAKAEDSKNLMANAQIPLTRLELEKCEQIFMDLAIQS